MNNSKKTETALQGSEALFWHLFDNMSSGVAVYAVLDNGRDFVFIGLNRAGEKISHISREEVIGKGVLELFPTVEDFGLLDVFRRVWSSGKSEHHPVAEFQDRRFIGWIENYVYKLPSGQIVAIFDDVTARKKAEDQLKQQKELLESTIDALDHPFCVISVKDYRIEVANKAARILGANAELTTCYALTHKLDHPCSGSDHICPMEQVVRTKKPVIIEHTHLDVNHAPYPVEIRGYPLFDNRGNVECMIEYTLDITERKQAESILEKAAATAERERLARDLHDAVSQNLFSAGLIAELLPELWEVNQAGARESLAKLRQLIRATSAEMRTMLLELRPDSLTEASLAYLLDHLGETVTSRAGVTLETDLDTNIEVPVEVKIALYRIVQESLNNIAKHARASTVKLSCRQHGEKVAINIWDNGHGFDPNAIPAGHMGIRIMHERAAQIDGTLQVQSRPGQGTGIIVQWSYKGVEE